MMNAERRLRLRIRRVLTEAGIHQNHSDSVMSEVERQLMELLAEYSRAPEELKDKVYASIETRILRTLSETKTHISGAISG